MIQDDEDGDQMIGPHEQNFDPRGATLPCGNLMVDNRLIIYRIPGFGVLSLK